MRRSPIAITFLLVLLAGCGERPPDAGSTASREPARFVGRQSCAACHEAQVRAFTGSDHDLAMQPATAETVLGDFDDASFTHSGVTSTFHRRGDSFIVRTDGPDGALHEYPIAYTFGIRPLQQYLVETERGRFQTLGLSWDARPVDEGGRRWFHVYGDEQIDHRDELHWTKPLQNWNYMCAECHSTHLDKGYVAAEDRYETTWSEIDVSCESCHGPGSNHVAWARAVEAGEAPTDADDGLEVRLRVPDETHWTFDVDAPTARRAMPLAENAQVETCGRCHSRRTRIWPEYRHGGPLADTHRVALLDEGLYHADGQILDEVYVHGSFLQSRMYHEGVTCSDCHEPHGGGLWAPGNALCARCHRADVFDTPDHHFHPAGSPGAQCVECHMPDRDYMLVDPRRDHSFRVPRPDLTVRIGAPNACGRCHEDQSAQWASEKVREWYGPQRSDTPHFGEALHAGRRGLPGARDMLLAVIDDEETPAIVRATAVELLRGQSGEAAAAAIVRTLRDDDPLVRRAAVGMLDLFPAEVARTLGEPALSDPVRTVRLEAAMAMAGPMRQRPAEPGAFDRAVDEYRISQRFNADRAEAHFNLGNLEARLGNAETAEQSYRAALVLQDDFVPASVNLADLLRATGRDADAERALRESLGVRKTAAAHHALGLTLIRQQRRDEALKHLAAAARLGPEDPRYAYVYAVALHDLGDAPKAIVVLEDAQRLHPGNRDVLAALADYCRKAGRAEDARRWADRLEALTQP